MFKNIDLSRVVIVPREEYDRMKQAAAQQQTPKPGDRKDLVNDALRYLLPPGVTFVSPPYASQIAAAKEADRTAPRVERPFVEPEPVPGAFLSADEDRELVAMGREIYDALPPQGNCKKGTFDCYNKEVLFADVDWRPAFVPDNPEHLTDAARALLRRVRDERKSTTPKEG